MQQELDEEDPYKNSDCGYSSKQGCELGFRRIFLGAMGVVCVIGLLEIGALLNQWHMESVMDKISHQGQQLTVRLYKSTPVQISNVTFEVEKSFGINVDVNVPVTVIDNMNHSFEQNNYAVTGSGSVGRLNGYFKDNEFKDKEHLGAGVQTTTPGAISFPLPGATTRKMVGGVPIPTTTMEASKEESNAEDSLFTPRHAEYSLFSASPLEQSQEASAQGYLRSQQDIYENNNLPTSFVSAWKHSVLEQTTYGISENSNKTISDLLLKGSPLLTPGSVSANLLGNAPSEGSSAMEPSATMKFKWHPDWLTNKNSKHTEEIENKNYDVLTPTGLVTVSVEDAKLHHKEQYPINVNLHVPIKLENNMKDAFIGNNKAATGGNGTVQRINGIMLNNHVNEESS